METKRKIPYGVMNWAKLVRECFFVDNTAYIRTLENVETPVFLRPKRFGKSVVCSMLAHYYDVNLKDRFDELFGKTDIGRNPTRRRSLRRSTTGRRSPAVPTGAMRSALPSSKSAATPAATGSI